MTNREYLSTLSNTKFAEVVLAKEAELHEKNFDPELDIFDISLGEKYDFENWLAEEYTGEINYSKEQKEKAMKAICGLCEMYNSWEDKFECLDGNFPCGLVKEAFNKTIEILGEK